MIHTQCKMLSVAEFLLNLFLQTWLVGIFSVSFHKWHINSSYRSKTKPHTQLLTLASSLQTTSDVYGWDLCTVQLCEMWNCPMDELQSVLLCILLKNVSWTRGEGKCWYVLPCLQDTDGPDMLVTQCRWRGCWAAIQQRWMKSEKFRGKNWHTPKGISIWNHCLMC